MGNCTSSCLRGNQSEWSRGNPTKAEGEHANSTPARGRTRPAKYTVYVIDSFEVPLCETKEQFRLMTVKDVKTKIFEKTKDERYNPDDHTWDLYFEGNMCKDDSLLSEIGINPTGVFSVGKTIVKVDSSSMEGLSNFEVDEDFN